MNLKHIADLYLNATIQRISSPLIVSILKYTLSQCDSMEFVSVKIENIRSCLLYK